MSNQQQLQPLLSRLGFARILRIELIQTLWSGYGEIARIHLDDAKIRSIIIKNIDLSVTKNHPRGWNTDRSHLRKVKSYEVEQEWYSKWADQCDTSCRIPKCYFSTNEVAQQLILLEDLNPSGYPKRRESLEMNEAKTVLKWLANFHATFMNSTPDKLWDVGTYWHLSTRPDEWKEMTESKLKSKALEIDQLLTNCQFKTIVHGDAKVGNFCFSGDCKSVAAVDFQYVGGGCGMKDVAYFLGSCLTENECERHETDLLDYYFEQLTITVSNKQPNLNVKLIEQEWKRLFPLAWADFTRFLVGWSPSHRKLNNYSEKMVERALKLLD